MADLNDKGSTGVVSFGSVDMGNMHIGNPNMVIHSPIKD